MLTQSVAAAVLLLAASPVVADPPAPADPLTATVHTEDADRFATLFAKTDGQPTAEQLQSDYLDSGSYGIEVFTPDRIVSAQWLAKAVAHNPDDYRKAIQTCLPLARQATADLRSIYLGLHGALPEARLPQVYFVFGAGNSGGTAGLGAQVLGLEVLCQGAADPAAFRRTVRHFFAHETVHAFQRDAGGDADERSLLEDVLAEGAADFIARLVTGEEPDTERAEWARPREAELWRRFQADIAPKTGAADPEEGKRWVGNYSTPPDGWPSELGYWIGLRIWERYYAAAADKRAALDEMLTLRDPAEVLRIGAFKRD